MRYNGFHSRKIGDNAVFRFVDERGIAFFYCDSLPPAIHRSGRNTSFKQLNIRFAAMDLREHRLHGFELAMGDVFGDGRWKVYNL